jgi:ABC-type polysaccharide/polyol phosphate transport system ATPase subunit
VSRAAVVRFEGVWKRFHTGRRHASLRDLAGAWTSRRRARDDGVRGDFWALSDVTLALAPGEALGIIGPNGAGKSTVLRLLTGILRPTLGHVTVQGRIGALIELAAGFHPDLTGRENVFLQGAIMGMRRADVRRRLDEIVAFAGVEPFIDTPVKRYSNGMSARLGFAVAAHLDPDLLLIDEALSVGDQAFQRRAIAHVRGTLDRGVPVVLVTHQLDLVSDLCRRAVLLAGGRIAKSGTAEECVSEYVRSGEVPAEEAPVDVPVRLLEVTAQPGESVVPGTPVTVRIRGEIARSDMTSRAGVALRVHALPSEELLFVTSTRRAGLSLPPSGPFTLEVTLRFHLGAGFYRVQASVVDRERRVEWARGPSTMIGVRPTDAFAGPVFLDPAIRLVEPR